MQGFSHIPKKRKVQPVDGAPVSADALNAEEVNQTAASYSPHIQPGIPEKGEENAFQPLNAGGTIWLQGRYGCCRHL
jgi:hypothetical protein